MTGPEVDDLLVDGRYARRAPLGRGGFGIVWRAHDTLLERDVAMKEVRFPPVLTDEEQAALREKVLREARAAARLSHPAVVTVYDVVEEDGRPFIVMELVDAPNLAEIVHRDGPLTEEKAAEIGLEVLGALTGAHTQGIIHRDVKPANVMVSDTGRVQLADFGIASILEDPKVSSSGQLAGSPSYMAPEQAQNRPPTAATDLWGLGATLYFAVEGVPPFEREGAIATLTSVVIDEPREMERARRLAPLLTELLGKSPDERPTAEETRRRLEEVAADRPAIVPPPSDRSPTQRYDEEALAAALAAATGGGSGEATEAAPAPQPPAPEPGPTAPATVASASPAAAPPAPAPTPPAPAGAAPAIPAASPPTQPATTPPAPEPRATEARPGPAPVGPAPGGVATRPHPPPRPVRPTTANPPRTRSLIAVVALVTVAALAILLATRDRGGPGTETVQESPLTTAGSGTDDTTGATTPAAPDETTAAERPRTTTAPRSGDAPRDWVVYQDPTTGYSISHPPGWTVSTNGSLTDFRDPATGAYLRVDFTTEPGPSPVQAWRDFEPEFAAENPNYERIRIEPTTFKGYDAAIWEFTYTGLGAPLHAADLGFVTGSYGFALNFQTPAGQWDSMQDVFEAFQDSFEVPAT